MEHRLERPSPVGAEAALALSDAIEAVYRRDFARFLCVATAIIGDRDRAGEAVQEAFADALTNAERLRRPEAMDAWLWRSVLNAARDERRRASRQRTNVDEHGDLTLIAGRARADSDVEIRGAVARLSERQRLVLFLRYYADLDYAAIGTALGIRRGTVGATLAQAHTALRKRLETT